MDTAETSANKCIICSKVEGTTPLTLKSSRESLEKSRNMQANVHRMGKQTYPLSVTGLHVLQSNTFSLYIILDAIKISSTMRN